MPNTRRKKLIEVALPLEFINPEATRQKKKAPKGYPTSLHKWWAQRPLATCRAVLFAQLVDDPSSWPNHFPTEEDQKRERERLHRIIATMVPWEVSNNEFIMNNARWEIARSIAWGLGAEPPAKSDPKAVLSYLQAKAPPIYDPFCGSGSIPLEAQRLGLRAYGSDLNPVSVLISKALVEIPPKFAGWPPVNPDRDPHRIWKGAEGLAEDVRYYGQWMRDEAEKRLGHLYPKAALPDGSDTTVIAWLWARTVASPDPMAKSAHVPLVSSFMLSTKKEKKVWIEVILDLAVQDGWRFEVKTRSLTAEKEKQLKEGTKVGRGSNFTCVLTGTPISDDYVKAEGKAGRMRSRLMAVVVDGRRGRVYLSPNVEHEAAAIVDAPQTPELEQSLPKNPRWFSPPDYGMPLYKDLFTPRQLTVLTTFSDLVGKARDRVLAHAHAASLPGDTRSLADGGAGAEAYADVITTYLAFVIDRMAAYGSTLSTWLPKDSAIRSVFNRQAIQMAWDFVEPNVFTKSSGGVTTCTNVVAACVEAASCVSQGQIGNSNAANGLLIVPQGVVVSTDPPYFDNVGYADLSDYFYIWLRRSIRHIWPNIFRRVLTPKDEELVATPYRHNGQDNAEAFFFEGMRRALANIATIVGSDIPVTIY